MTRSETRYHTLSSWLRIRFGTEVRKISLDAGLGCPNRDGTLGTTGCIYCNAQGSGTGKSSLGMSLSRQVMQGIARLSTRPGKRKFIAYLQSFTNTYGRPEQLAALYREAISHPEVVGLALGTRPDCAPDEILDVLAAIARTHLVWVEYGLQSAHGRTLHAIRRCHGPEAFFDAVARTRARGIAVVAHLILGLPGESVDDMVQTAKAVAAAGAQGVKLHPLYVVRGTELEQWHKDGRYRSLSLHEAVDATLAVLAALPWEVVIHRLTSDPHPGELVAPLWMLDRRAVRTALVKKMDEVRFRQGSALDRQHIDATTGRK